MSPKRECKVPTALKRRVLSAMAAGPACLVAAAVITAPMSAIAASPTTDEISPETTRPVKFGPPTHATPPSASRGAQIWANIPWWQNGWHPRWGNWNNWHNWPNWHNWHNWGW